MDNFLKIPPFSLQVWVNGREWLARQLDRENIAYMRYHNTFLSIEDLPRALGEPAQPGRSA